jgi:membrane protein implicated in regulation of membrane protease activity
MEAWMMWFILAGVVLVLEFLTGTFYLIMISFGLAAGGIAALCGLGTNLQSLIAATVWIVSTLILRKTKWGKPHHSDADKDPNINMDIGQQVQVEVWNDQRSARVMYRGAMWDVELLSGEAVPGTFVIREVRASRLFVEKI